MAAVIRVNGLQKRFGDLEVLRGIDCAIDALPELMSGDIERARNHINGFKLPA